MVLHLASPEIPRSDKKHAQLEPQRELHIHNSDHRRWRNTEGQANKPIPSYVLTYANTVAGYDEGGFSASVDLESFKQDFNLVADHWEDNPGGLASRKANITSFGVLGAGFGSLLALIFIDRIGRLRSWQLFVLLWATGIFMQIFSSGIIGLMLFARIWGGLGAGGLTVIAPLYLSEIALAKSRGTVVSMYMVVLLSFLTIGLSFSLSILSSQATINKK
jgi:MFS family permease